MGGTNIFEVPVPGGEEPIVDESLRVPEEMVRPRRSDRPEDRRTEDAARDRRRNQAERGSRIAHAPEEKQLLVVPANWPWMAFSSGTAFVVTGLVTRAVPTALTCVMVVLALTIHLSGPQLRRWERTKKPGFAGKAVLGLVGIVLPMGLSGFALARYASIGGASWYLAVAGLIGINTFASAILSQRLRWQFAGLFASWAAVVVVTGNNLGVSALIITTLAAFAVLRMQESLEREIQARENARNRARNRAEDILHDYEETGQGWFWETDRRGQLTYLSKPVARVLKRRHDSFIGRPFTDLFNLAEEQEGERTLTFHLSSRASFSELGVRAATQDDRYWSISGRPVYDNFKNFCGFRGSGTDLTEKKRTQEKATRLAHYDSLTGLANRFQMSQALEKILNAPQELQRNCTVLLLDLDRFKAVNDTLGHPAGDALLKQVSQRLESTVDALGLVGRLGGDEFKIILPGVHEREALGHLAKRIIDNVSQPYSIDGHRVTIGTSVGIALSPDNGVTSEAVIRNADLALYAAKDGGRGRYHFYADDLHSEAEERHRMEEHLRDAIANGGLELHYQPQVNTATERISGFEALLRWTHPTKGRISPAKFIPIAEDTGLIAAIGEWALRQACMDMATWDDSVRVAVNVSPLQFANPQLPALVTNAIARAGISPSRLELEITESVFLNDDEGTDAMFASLKGVGVRLALDDFGTGYSSLGYLKKAPFDKIKIDQSFVRGATLPGSRNGAIIASITSLAQALGMDTIAEGVETMDELDLVRMHGCSHVQGYIYEKPLSMEQATARLAQGLVAVADGFKSARKPRQTMLRKVTLDHGGQVYKGTIRNITAEGAMVEGLWNVPPGTIFQIALSDHLTVTASARWCKDDRMGVEFAEPLKTDVSGKLDALAERPEREVRPLLRKAG